MLDIHAEIVPATSAGGVMLGANLSDVVSSMSETGIAYEERHFANFGKEYIEVFAPQFGLKFVSDETGEIVRVSCREPYRGRYRQYFPGMTVSQLRQIAGKTLVIHGMIVPDGEYGIALDIPEFFEGKLYDDLDYVEQLPVTMPLKEIHIQGREWWR